MTPSSSIAARVEQREHLEAARVGQDRPVPAHEAVQAAQLGDHVLARAGSAGGRCCRARSARRCRSSSPASCALTVALVPTGMKAGVSIGPCAVCSVAGPRGAVRRMYLERARLHRPQGSRVRTMGLKALAGILLAVLAPPAAAAPKPPGPARDEDHDHSRHAGVADRSRNETRYELRAGARRVRLSRNAHTATVRSCGPTPATVPRPRVSRQRLLALDAAAGADHARRPRRPAARRRRLPGVPGLEPVEPRRARRSGRPRTRRSTSPPRWPGIACISTWARARSSTACRGRSCRRRWRRHRADHVRHRRRRLLATSPTTARCRSRWARRSRAGTARATTPTAATGT